jgi:hypothetical protein
MQNRQEGPGTKGLSRSARSRGLLAASLLFASGLGGCAPWQVVAIDAEPAPIEVFVDGRRVVEMPADGLRLRADRSHILHFEREGYRAEQVVLERVAGEDPPRLNPDRVSVRLHPIEMRTRQIDVELQPVHVPAQIEEGVAK